MFRFSMKKRFTEEQIVRILQEAEAAMSTRDVCRKHGICGANVLPVEDEVRRYGRVGCKVVEGARAGERRVEEDRRRPDAGQPDVEGRERKKILSLPERRRCATYLKAQYEVSERRACEVISLQRSSKSIPRTPRSD